MKTLYKIALTVFSLNSLAQAPMVYLDFVTHNEDHVGWSGATYYASNRAKLVQLANYFQTKGITLNMQSDYTYLNSAIAKETGTLLTSTSGKTILRWMYEDKGVEMDPHSHENVYIYPDIVKLMDSIGLPQSKIIGGTLYNQMNGINTWTNLINGQNGVMFPAKFWKPTYMMGGGTPNHTADINSYGFWNPQNMTNYITHDPTQPLIHFGVGCAIKVTDTTTVQETVDAIRTLINRVQSGQYPSNGFYFQSIFFGQGDLNLLNFYPKLIQVADSISAIVATGNAQWKTMKQAYTLWETNYAAQMFMWGCGSITGINEYTMEEKISNIYPNPAQNFVNVKLKESLEGFVNVQLLDMTGKEVKSIYTNDDEVKLKLDDMPNGLYLIKVTNVGSKTETHKVIIDK